MNISKFGFVIGMTLLGGSVFATDLSFSGTADDAFVAYVSTSPTSVGSSFVNGGSWGTTFTGSATLTPGVVNYLHVDAFDVAGAPSMFIAESGLSNTDFAFGNGTQSALTGDSGWGLSLVSFGGTSTSITNLGPNGTSPWGMRGGISANASYLWSAGPVSDHRYFTIAINPTAVPEPASMAAIATGLAIFLKRKRARKS